MTRLAGLAILGILSFSFDAQARTHHHRLVHAPPRPLVVNVVPPPFGDRYAFFSPPGPCQLSSPYRTLCGFALVTNCWQETSYGP